MAVVSPDELPDGDRIQATITRSAVEPEGVEFVLETDPATTWWKGLHVPDGEGNSVSKAKFLGSHRVVYRLGDLGRLAPGITGDLPLAQRLAAPRQGPDAADCARW